MPMAKDFMYDFSIGIFNISSDIVISSTIIALEWMKLSNNHLENVIILE